MSEAANLKRAVERAERRAEQERVRCAYCGRKVKQPKTFPVACSYCNDLPGNEPF